MTDINPSTVICAVDTLVSLCSWSLKASISSQKKVMFSLKSMSGAV